MLKMRDIQKKRKETKYKGNQVIEIVECFLCSIHQHEFIFSEKKKPRGFEC